MFVTLQYYQKLNGKPINKIIFNLFRDLHSTRIDIVNFVNAERKFRIQKYIKTF